MAKVRLIYGVMKTGKTVVLMQIIYNYEKSGHKVLIAKPFVDKKGGEYLESRMTGKFYRPVDLMIKPEDTFIEACKKAQINPLDYDYIAIDEAQFLSKEQIYEMWVLAKEDNREFIFASLKTNFLGEFFEGSQELLARADEKTELFCSCEIKGCKDVAQYNARKINGEWMSSGDVVVIDGLNQEVQYISVCGQHFYQFTQKAKASQYVLR